MFFYGIDITAKALKALRSNWKKSTAATVGVGYGTAKIKEELDKDVLMREACEEASILSYNIASKNPPVVTVILNPTANYKAKQEYQRYCEPLLHLAGLQVNLVQTTSKRSAKDIVERLRDTDVIVVAGGDGMLSETITGLFQRNSNRIPIGILPLGNTNSVSEALIPRGKGVERIKQLIGASMAIIRGNTMWVDVIKIEPTSGQDEPIKPIYAMSSVEWGAFRDALAAKRKYSIYGSLSDYLALVFSDNITKDCITGNCTGLLKYTVPCQGCVNCAQNTMASPISRSLVWRLLFFVHNLSQSTTQLNEIIVNPLCGQYHELNVETCDLRIKSSNIDKIGSIPALKVVLGKDCYSYMEFLSEGWNRLQGTHKDDNYIPARTVEILPTDNVIIGIDEDELEVKRVKITLLPKIVQVFC